MSLPVFQALFLDPFDPPTTRSAICAALELMISDLMLWGVRCELWIDGDFLTDINDPEIANVAVIIEDSAFSILSIDLKNDILTNMDQRNYHDRIEIFTVVSKPMGHPDYGAVQPYLNDWMEFWSITQSRWLKGVAIIRIGETDVGLRLLS